MKHLLLLATGAITFFLGTLAPVYADDPPITEPPAYLRSAANGLVLNKAQKNGQYVCTTSHNEGLRFKLNENYAQS